MGDLRTFAVIMALLAAIIGVPLCAETGLRSDDWVIVGDTAGQVLAAVDARVPGSLRLDLYRIKLKVRARTIPSSGELRALKELKWILASSTDIVLEGALGQALTANGVHGS
ncbi:MAG: hypothetical protein PF961_04335 [Planctomycetota bacterium]|jgi:hypothetical protein|nr:hypothetical protein [Planctomycetota bacterium]